MGTKSLSTYYSAIQIEIAKNYGTVEWHEDLKLCLMQAGVDDKSVVFLFNDTQVNIEHLAIV